MQRTTLALENEILRQLKERAVKSNLSVTKLANRLLAKALAETEESDHRHIEWQVFDCGEPLVDLDDRESLYDAMDEQ